jgi:hypothetical protein
MSRIDCFYARCGVMPASVQTVNARCMESQALWSCPAPG